MDMKNISAELLQKIRKNAPLVHNITNYVVMNSSANILLALGASPVMAHSRREVEEMAAIAGALVLNIGTLSAQWVDAMLLAAKSANQRGIPVILDPVGAGATTYRSQAVQAILSETTVSVIRGNASEVLSLAVADVKTKGVDSSIAVSGEMVEAVGAIARQHGCIVAVSGETDLITDGSRVIRVQNGHPLMGYVTGTGCTATVTIGAFLAVDDDPVTAAATALAYFGLAGEVAGQNAAAPGSFMIQMLDALYTITPEALEAGCKIEAS